MKKSGIIKILLLVFVIAVIILVLLYFSNELIVTYSLHNDKYNVLSESEKISITCDVPINMSNNVQEITLDKYDTRISYYFTDNDNEVTLFLDFTDSLIWNSSHLGTVKLVLQGKEILYESVPVSISLFSITNNKAILNRSYSIQMMKYPDSEIAINIDKSNLYGTEELQIDISNLVHSWLSIFN